jgi:hypothetical protein
MLGFSGRKVGHYFCFVVQLSTAHIWTASVIDKTFGKHNKKETESRLQQILEMLSALITVFVVIIIIITTTIIIIIVITGRVVME